MKIYSKQNFLKVFFAGLFIITFFCLFQRQSENIVRQSSVEKQFLTFNTQSNIQRLPLHLRIPIINIDTTIEALNLTATGEMAVPNNIVNVGWFDLGPRPGDRGSAVIDGHLDGKNGEAGVFNNLNKLKAGDKLYIEDNKGASFIFIVRETRTYDPGYADDVFNSKEGSHLNLITCDGYWDGVKKNYSKRLVVFSDILNLKEQM